MKILTAADFHGDIDAVKKLADKAYKENVDLVILCGDITSGERTDNLIGPFLKKNKKVLMIPGNHDSFATADFLAELYGIKNIHGMYVKYKDIGIVGCGGANIGLEQLSEDEIFNILKEGFEKIKGLKKKIMVTHVHPANTKMAMLSNFVPPSTGVERAIKEFQPDILFCSHIHEAEGIEEKIGNTKIINVGKNGKIIEV